MNQHALIGDVGISGSVFSARLAACPLQEHLIQRRLCEHKLAKLFPLKKLRSQRGGIQDIFTSIFFCFEMYKAHDIDMYESALRCDF